MISKTGSLFIRACLLFIIINAAKLQICQKKGVQSYSSNSKSYDILCDQGPGSKLWLVILSRFDGKTDFYNGKTFADYENDGVGTVQTQFFAPLKLLHQITNQYQMELYVTMAEGRHEAWAYYKKFKVGNPGDKYRLQVSGFIDESTAGDSLLVHNGMQFSTPDQDNDGGASDCSNQWRSAYWFNHCYESNPLGEYGSTGYGRGINWKSFKDYVGSLDRIKFMLRPRQFTTSRLCQNFIFEVVQCLQCSQTAQVPIKKIKGYNDQLCVTNCTQFSKGFYQVSEVCTPCHEDCQSCSGPNNYNCLSCATGFIEDKASTLKDPKHCVQTCPPGSYPNKDNICQSCHENCYTCSGPNSYNCNTCAKGKKQDRASTQKDPKHCVSSCPSGFYSFKEQFCFPCHKDCQSCSGPNSYNCNTCATGKKEDRGSAVKNPKHCVQACPIGSSQISENVCEPSSSNVYFFIVIVIFLLGMPLTISLWWRVLRSPRRKQWSQINETELEGAQHEGHIDLTQFYYSEMQLSKNKCSEYVLCLLASSDLTFASLNLDLLFLRSTVAILNMTRSIAFLLSNVLIYIYYSNQLSYVNIIPILILVPLPFMYKCITPKMQSKYTVISRDVKVSFENKKENNSENNIYTLLNLSKNGMKNLVLILAILLTVGLVFLLVLLEQPDLKWMLFVVMIQIGSYLFWSILWGSICFIAKRNNLFGQISRIPDWRVEMVFQDLYLMTKALMQNQD